MSASTPEPLHVSLLMSPLFMHTPKLKKQIILDKASINTCTSSAHGGHDRYFAPWHAPSMRGRLVVSVEARDRTVGLGLDHESLDRYAVSRLKNSNTLKGLPSYNGKPRNRCFSTSVIIDPPSRVRIYIIFSPGSAMVRQR